MVLYGHCWCPDSQDDYQDDYYDGQDSHQDGENCSQYGHYVNTILCKKNVKYDIMNIPDTLYN